MTLHSLLFFYYFHSPPAEMIIAIWARSLDSSSSSSVIFAPSVLLPGAPLSLNESSSGAWLCRKKGG